MDWLISNVSWLFSGLGIVLFSGIITLVIRFSKSRTTEKKVFHLKTIDIDDIDMLKRLIEGSTEIKIFSSGSETYRIKLNIIFKLIKVDKKKTIKILIRDDGSPQRNDKINEEIRKWKIVVENNNTQMVDFEFKRYEPAEGSVMLRGYIFDNNYAILGWYLNTVEYRYGNNCPMVLYSDVEIHQSEIIKFAIKTFEYFYKKKE